MGSYLPLGSTLIFPQVISWVRYHIELLMWGASEKKWSYTINNIKVPCVIYSFATRIHYKSSQKGSNVFGYIRNMYHKGRGVSPATHNQGNTYLSLAYGVRAVRIQTGGSASTPIFAILYRTPTYCCTLFRKGW